MTRMEFMNTAICTACVLDSRRILWLILVCLFDNLKYLVYSLNCKICMLGELVGPAVICKQHSDGTSGLCAEQIEEIIAHQ